MYKRFIDFLYNLSLHRINIFRVIFIVFLCGARIQMFAFPAPGDLDPTFNQAAIGGQQGAFAFKIDSIESGSAGFGCEMQKDGKILVAGFSNIEGTDRFTVARLNQDGTLDSSFNGTGTNALKIDQLEYRSEAMRLAVQADGKILVFGNMTLNLVDFSQITKFVVARFLPNGTLDLDFNKDGVGSQSGTATVEINSSDNVRCYAGAIQKDEKIVLVGDANFNSQKNFVAARFNVDGTLDENFNIDGAQKGVALTTIDNNMGDHECYHVALDSSVVGNEKIVLAGYTTDITNIDNPVKKFGIVRFNDDGTLDQDFNSSGEKPGTVSTKIDNNTDSICYAVFMQEDGKIFLAGNTYDSINSLNKFAAARLNNDGTIDENFNVGGVKKGTVSTQIDDSTASVGTFGAVQINNKLLVTGMSFGAEAKFAIARFKDNGELDNTFNPNGILPGTVSVKIGSTSQVNYVYSSTIQEDGKIILAGSLIIDAIQQFAVARFIGDEVVVPVAPDAGSGSNPVTTPIIILKTKDPYSIRIIEKYGPRFAAVT